jgi:hypothetical protein
MDDAKRLAKEAKDRANAQMQAAKASAQRADTPAAAEPAPVPAAQRSCFACHAPLAADDVFCGECGKKND